MTSAIPKDSLLVLVMSLVYKNDLTDGSSSDSGSVSGTHLFVFMGIRGHGSAHRTLSLILNLEGFGLTQSAFMLAKTEKWRTEDIRLLKPVSYIFLSKIMLKSVLRSARNSPRDTWHLDKNILNNIFSSLPSLFHPKTQLLSLSQWLKLFLPHHYRLTTLCLMLKFFLICPT